ncbi:hypothetical protein FQN54_001639 [Arachnomyces sp. PD_36]|nr:hypothetical protein FQN54_001639 [Arachnomyces sp. PD_36]
MPTRRLTHEDYSVGWVCTLSVDVHAASMMLDEEHEPLPQNHYDSSTYVLGRMGEHNVVIASFPTTGHGTDSAFMVGVQMRSKFPSIKFSLMVGIGSGVPSADADIRLGDVVVGVPSGQHGGVIQCDFGKTTPSGMVQIGALYRPPKILSSAVSRLKASHLLGRGNLEKYLSRITDKPLTREIAGPDHLFLPTYKHVGEPTCENCDKNETVTRARRQGSEVAVHYGTIASGNYVIKDAIIRDKLSSQLGGILCIEMEAAGMMARFPCVVIRGISDYADSHKNKRWWGYAAATAAAFARELLSTIPPTINGGPWIPEELYPDHGSTASEKRQEHPRIDSRCKELCKSFYAHVETDHFVGITGSTNESYKSVYDIIYNDRQDFWGAEVKSLSDQVNVNETEVQANYRRWIHLPANNISWVKVEFPAKLKFVDESLFERKGPTLHASSREPSCQADIHGRLSLVVPYIDMESETYLNRKTISPNLHVMKMKRLITEYQTTADIHVSRTLDQSSYETMESTADRDYDQVVYRYTKKNIWSKQNAESKDENVRATTLDAPPPRPKAGVPDSPDEKGQKQTAKLLMVNQLWLWKMDDTTIISASPERWHEGNEHKLLSSLLATRLDWFRQPLDEWVMRIVLRCIHFSEEPWRAGLDELYTSIFARSIATVANKEVKCYRSFKEAVQQGKAKSLEIREEITLLQEIKDIRDELNMLNHVLSDQKDVVARLLRYSGKDIESDFEHEWGTDARCNRVARMSKDADRVERSINHLLDLKQKQSNLEEAISARKQAEDTARQGQYIFIFTVVTIIFVSVLYTFMLKPLVNPVYVQAPLSFMAALFALQISEFPHDDKGLDLPGSWVGRYMAAAELATLGLVACVSIGVVYRSQIAEMLQAVSREVKALGSFVRVITISFKRKDNLSTETFSSDRV